MWPSCSTDQTSRLVRRHQLTNFLLERHCFECGDLSFLHLYVRLGKLVTEYSEEHFIRTQCLERLRES